MRHAPSLADVNLMTTGSVDFKTRSVKSFRDTGNVGINIDMLLKVSFVSAYGKLLRSTSMRCAISCSVLYTCRLTRR